MQLLVDMLPALQKIFVTQNKANDNFPIEVLFDICYVKISKRYHYNIFIFILFYLIFINYVVLFQFQLSLIVQLHTSKSNTLNILSCK